MFLHLNILIKGVDDTVDTAISSLVLSKQRHHSVVSFVNECSLKFFTVHSNKNRRCNSILIKKMNIIGNLTKNKNKIIVTVIT